MSEIKDGGAAFPTTGMQYNIDRDEFEVGSYSGMSLRDYFAAHAPEPPVWWKHDAEHEEQYYKWRWHYADAMLAQRGKP